MDSYFILDYTPSVIVKPHATTMINWRIKYTIAVFVSFIKLLHVFILDFEVPQYFQILSLIFDEVHVGGVAGLSGWF